MNLHWPSLLAGKWLDRDQTCTGWSPGEPASRVCSRSRSRSKVTWYGHFCAGTKIASLGLLGYVELFIIRVKFAIYYFLHFNTVRQVAARLRAKSAIYDFLVLLADSTESETLAINVADEARLEAAEMWFLRRMLCISWTAHESNDNVLTRAGTGRHLLTAIRTVLGSCY